MRYLLLLIALVLQAETIKMEDGQCYEKVGKMHYVTPCPKESEAHTEERSCVYTLGEYRLEYLKPTSSAKKALDCDALLENIKSMHLVYETSLITDKVKIAAIQVKYQESLCKVELYSGDFIYVGLMSGDQLVCNGFMEYHSRLAK